MIQRLILAVFAFLSFLPISNALESADLLSSRIQKALAEKTPFAEIRLPNLEKLSKTEEVSNLRDLSIVRVVEERANSVAVLDLTSSDGINVRVQTPYQALVRVPVANKRIFPNTKIKKEDYRFNVMNIAESPAKEYRGVIVYDEKKLDNVESKQTILEGQFIVSNAIQKTPDLRKGETVRLLMNSGDLILSTAATILESASVGEQVKVMTDKTKRELTGRVNSDRSVEVSL